MSIQAGYDLVTGRLRLGVTLSNPLLGVGISGMLRVWREVGRPFGGFVWGWDFTTRSLTVVVETPWHWPGPQHGLRGGDRILAVPACGSPGPALAGASALC